MKETFTGRIRTAAKAIAPDTFTARDLSERAGIGSWDKDRRIRCVIRELKKTGEIVRMDRGVYAYAGQQKQKNEIKKVMWRLLRARGGT